MSFQRSNHLNGSAISCGVSQLFDLYETPNYLLKGVYNYHFSDSFRPAVAFYIFSDTVDSGGGQALATFIRKNRLGIVSATTKATNPNTDNQIKVWVWRVNQAAFNAWGQTNKSKRSKRG